MIVPNWLDLRAGSHGGHPAVVADGRTFTYAELRERVAAAAADLRERGVGSGSHVAVLLPNGIAFAVVTHALMRCRAVLVPLGLRLTATEIVAQLADAKATVLVTDPERAALARDVEERGWRGKTVDATTLASSLPPDDPAPPIDLAARHCILFTSGSSGRPKGVSLSYANHLWSAVGSSLRLGLHRDDRWLACLPPSHIGGLSILLRSVIYGTTALLQEGFDPNRVNRAIDDDAVTIVSVVANMLQRMLDARGGTNFPSSLRCVLLGGGPAPRALLETCASRGVPVVQTYGLTEAASQVATGSPAATHDCVGRPLPCTEVAIDPGGEILVRGPTVASAYVNSETPLADGRGWLHTGDLGSLTDGHLAVTGRRDDMIVTGGENVQPLEVELALQSHPAVAEACVFGVADERWGRAVHAQARLIEGATATSDELVAHLRARLAAYKVPRVIERVDDFPRTASGKIRRPRH